MPISHNWWCFHVGYYEIGIALLTLPFMAELPHYVGPHGDRIIKPSPAEVFSSLQQRGNLRDPEEHSPLKAGRGSDGFGCYGIDHNTDPYTLHLPLLSIAVALLALMIKVLDTTRPS